MKRGGFLPPAAPACGEGWRMPWKKPTRYSRRSDRSCPLACTPVSRSAEVWTEPMKVADVVSTSSEVYVEVDCKMLRQNGDSIRPACSEKAWCRLSDRNASWNTSVSNAFVVDPSGAVVVRPRLAASSRSRKVSFLKTPPAKKMRARRRYVFHW